MVPPGGLEPPTPGFSVPCYYQLSYSGMVRLTSPSTAYCVFTDPKRHFASKRQLVSHKRFKLLHYFLILESRPSAVHSYSRRISAQQV